MNKKGQVTGTLSNLAGAAVLFVVLAVAFGVGGDILQDVQDDQTSGTAAHNASGDGLTGLTKMSGKLGILATIVMAGVFITLISRAFSA